MKAFTVKTTIAGNEEQVEQVFASTTRLALQRAIYAIYEKTPELTTGESRSMTISCQRIPYTKPMAQLHHHAVRVRSQEFHDKVKLALIDRDMVGDIMATKEGIVVGSIIASSSNKNLIR